MGTSASMNTAIAETERHRAKLAPAQRGGEVGAPSFEPRKKALHKAGGRSLLSLEESGFHE